ncbi:MAG: SDR family oxidoreductase [Novosphingobium sp.]|nr:SDR family oxidoreductase [Novosphingobium sp.]MCP5404110.1 SDR family oxidoreductase [Novosphingobium sp.]
MTDSKVMLITGGSGSVGAAIAREALSQGWAVVVHGRNAGKLGELVDMLRPVGPAEAVALDMWQDEAAERLITEAAAKFGRLDAVVDCVATGPSGPRITGFFKDTEPAGYTPFYNLSAAWFQRLAHAAYPHLQERGGTLIGFISDAGRFAAPRQTIIGAARAAEIGFIRNFAVEAARDGIRAHCLSPSYVEGSESARKMGSERMAKAAQRAGLGLPSAEDIAPITVFLCGDGAAKITGQVISINGGLNA